jgi:hypothetical protein
VCCATRNPVADEQQFLGISTNADCSLARLLSLCQFVAIRNSQRERRRTMTDFTPQMRLAGGHMAIRAQVLSGTFECGHIQAFTA